MSIQVSIGAARSASTQSDFFRQLPTTDFLTFANDFVLSEMLDTPYAKVYLNATKHFGYFQENQDVSIKYKTNQISPRTLTRFIYFQQEVEKLAANTSIVNAQRIRYLLKRAHALYWAIDTSVLEQKFIPRECFSVVLNQKEIDQLYFCRCLTKKEEEIRDLFVMQCQTGMRYSDVSKIRPEHFKDGIIVKKTQKTKSTVYVPVDSYVQEIITKYNGEIPRPRSIQHYNKVIKRVCEKAGLTKPVSYETECAGEVVLHTSRKCDEISSHDARRSFVTNHFRRGTPADEIAVSTGHKSMNCLMRYNKRDKEKIARARAAREE